MVINVRKKISITIDEELVKQLEEQAQKINLSLSRLIENKLKEVKKMNKQMNLERLKALGVKVRLKSHLHKSCGSIKLPTPKNTPKPKKKYEEWELRENPLPTKADLEHVKNLGKKPKRGDDFLDL